MNCQACGAVIHSSGKTGRQETCPKCNAALHCCRNCRFFSESAYHQCREDQSEFVSDKTAANFCDYFEAAEGRAAGTDSRRENARKKLDDLFKK
jgi:hypothetical protein